ncbi:MAG: long-chain fatty acid--CoA ligase [SAR86 cluster bacterium]|uniref:Long-chain-fatty-acid--CoA ligase n=1 Tax=SAR86 cluster bacterium TaxID=2030880 RepID=A0A2A5AGG0_9GAMM|nr:MAG: long-chain fatty acid--CoA ligase [SAR86 cluster bacterium]
MIEKLHDDLQPGKFSSLPEVIKHFCVENADLPAFSCFGHTLSYREVDELSNRFANYITNETDLKPGDRIAIQLPNVLQFPIVFYGAVRAGLVVVNTNPLYTKQEMLHQFKDSGVKAIVILSNFCDKLEAIIDQTDIQTVIVSQLGDLQKPLKRRLVNFVAKYIRKMVPAYTLKGSIDFQQALDSSPPNFECPGIGSHDDVAVLLYTGGTTGFAKGAMLSHNNLIANMMQLRSRCLLIMTDKTENVLAPLPLYHSYAFLLHCLTLAYAGNHNILVTNPRDLNALVKLLAAPLVSGFVGINTLYLALLQHKDLASIDFSGLKFCGAGGMAMSTSVADEWQKTTGCEIFEGYGLTECSPVVSINIPGKTRRGTVGPVVPETEIKIVDDDGQEVAHGERGELWVRGPQVMQGYWRQEQATADAITTDGWLKTGDYVEIGADDYISIVDRKKDMILVSGFNVFPNDIEDWVNRHDAVLESAAIGVESKKTGESIKLFVVTNEKPVNKDQIIAHCKEGLTGYKIPRDIVFVKDLPKSNIGKILRRKLR